jgi:hypothetical protein
VKLAILVLQHDGQNRAVGPQLSRVLTPPKLKYVSPEALCKRDDAEVFYWRSRCGFFGGLFPSLFIGSFTSVRRACFPVRQGIESCSLRLHAEPEQRRFFIVCSISPCTTPRVCSGCRDVTPRGHSSDPVRARLPGCALVRSRRCSLRRGLGQGVCRTFGQPLRLVGAPRASCERGD